MKLNIQIFLICILSILFTGTVFSQEVCDNGIDDDNDGFVDCYDNSCAGNAACEDFYMGDEAVCEAKPSEFPTFSMKEAWGSPNGTAATWSRVSVGDVDGDGIPEVITTNRQTNKLFILNGDDGSIKQQINLSYAPEHEVAMADFEGDGYAEFIVSGRGMEVEAYTYNGTQFVKMWSYDTGGRDGYKGRPMVLGLADFKGTGNVQLYYKNEIVDAKTGLRLVNGFGDWEHEINFAPVAVDILDDSECSNCSGLELVSGGTIYSVNLGNGTKDSGYLTVEKTLPGNNYYVKAMGWENWSSTSVADYNLDGYLDVISSGAKNSRTGPTTVFYWDVKNNQLKTHSPFNNWKNGTGRLNIADIDGNGALNVTFVSGSYLFALKEDFTELWRQPINEVTSGMTGTTVFDFNGDNAYEIVYRDEDYLYIIDGTDGTVFSSDTCRSRTSSEYPVVADVDGDGATEICVVCNTDDNANEQDGNNTQHGQVRIYKSDGENWVPSRKVWNQHTYFNVNINDDLTIPREQQKHHLTFSTGECGAGANRPLNTFLNQSPYLDISGCPTFGAPDFTVLPETLEVDQPLCPDKTFTVSFDVRNDGDVSVSGNVPITFYEGNPLVAGAKKLNTVITPVTDLKPDSTISFTNLSVTGSGSAFTLFIAFNDAGTSTPPIALPNGGIIECNYDNNIISTAITPNPFPIVVEKIKDNLKCDDAYADNGAARAYIVDGSDTITAGYTFNWYIGTTVKTTPDFVGTAYTGLAEGTYIVMAINDAAKCGSLVDTVEIKKVSIDPDSETLIEVVQDVTSCKVDNGKLSAYVLKDGKKVYEEGNYKFTWYTTAEVFNDENLISIGHEATGLKVESYSVIVTDLTTGCITIATKTLGSALSTPKVELVIEKEINRCFQPNGGKLSAIVDGIKNNGDFSYRWYLGENAGLLLSHTGAQYPDLTVGKYTLIAVNKVTGCESAPVAVILGAKIADPEITVTNKVHPTSCLATSNGAIDISVSTPAPGTEPSGYTITWYKGTTTASPLVPTTNLSADRKSASGLGVGEYMIVVKNNNTDCSSTAYVTLEDKTVIPVLTATPADVSFCDPLNGAIITKVTMDGNTITGTDLDQYTFTWYVEVGGIPTIINGETGPSLSSRDAGKYSVKVTSPMGCTSNTAKPQIVSKKEYPRIDDGTIIPNTSCDPKKPNGSITASVNGSTVGYSFEWFESFGTTTDPLGTTVGETAGTRGETAQKLKAGRYTVKATDETTGCAITRRFTVGEDFTYPVLTAQSFENTICDPSLTSPAVDYDGRIEASLKFDEVPVTDFTNYIFTLYEGIGTGGAVVYTGASTNIINNLADGQYTLTATNTIVGCTSNELPIAVGSNQKSPAVTVTEEAKQTHCSPLTSPNGILSADVGGVVAGYTYKWFIGSDTTGTALAAANIGGSFGEKAINLAAGDYAVKVTNLATGCITVQPATLTERILKPVITASALENTICNPLFPDPDITYNGQIETKVWYDNVPVTDFSNYTFTLYEGDGTDGDEVSTGGSSNILENLQDGIYTVTATNTTLGCTSLPFKVTVGSNKTIPEIIVKEDAPQTHCNPSSSPNGRLSASVGGVTAGYTFVWYEGSGTAFPLGTNVGTTSGANGEIAENLPKGTYTVMAIDNATGCSATTPVILSEDIQDPIITAVPFENSICNPSLTVPSIPYNGRIEASVKYREVTITDFTDYTFTWYEGSGSTAVRIDGEIGEDLLNRKAGTYSVTVTNTKTGCTSNAVPVEILDDVTRPTIGLTVTNKQTHCDPDNHANGVITASVTGDPADYTFDWFEGSDTSDPLGTNTMGAVSATNKMVAEKLEAGFYLVRVSNKATGCFTTESIYLADDQNTPEISAASTPFTSCHVPDGTATATVDFDGTAPDGYTYSWYAGDAVVAANAISGATGPSISGQVPGKYTVVTTNNFTGCPSEPFIVEILDGSEELEMDGEHDLHITEAQECNNGTNTLTATGAVELNNINGIPLPNARFTFTWHVGRPTDPDATYFTDPILSFPGEAFNAEVVGTNTHHIQNLKPGVYSVEIYDSFSGCTKVKTFDVPYLGAEELDLTATIVNHSTVCGPGNGSIEVQLLNKPSDKGISDYTFVWYTGSNPDPANIIDGETGHTLTGLDPGDYSAVATQTFGNLCPGNPLTITIKQIAQPPTLTTAVKDNDACDSNHYNGEITITPRVADAIPPIDPADAIDSDTDGYNFTLYTGTTISGTPIGDADATTSPFTHTFTDLAPGKYIARVSNIKTGCYFDKEFEVGHQPATPVISNPVIVDKDVCNPSGSITIADTGVPSGDTDDYEFTWSIDGDVIAGVSGPLLDNTTYADFGGGTYYVTATPIAGAGIGCPSNTLEAIVKDNSIDPVIAFAQTPNTSCDTQNHANGTLTATVTTKGNPITINPDPTISSFQWFVGDGQSVPFVTTGENAHGTIANVGNVSTLSGLKPGKYTLVVTDFATGCPVEQTYTVEEKLVMPEFINLDDIVVADQDICNPSGSITITDASVSSGETDDYTFRWYLENTSTLPLKDINNNVIGTTFLDASNYPAMGAGTYYVTATLKTSHCTTPIPFRATVKEDITYPVIAFESTANTSCDTLNNPNGMLKATVTTGGNPITINPDPTVTTFQWFVGKDLTVPFNSGVHGTIATVGNVSTISDVKPGDYTLVVTDYTTGCQVKQFFTVDDDPVYPVITNVAVADRNICNDSGSLTITDADVLGDTDDYTFTWYRGSYDEDSVVATGNIPVLDEVSFAGMGEGTYYVIATSTASSCRSSAPVMRVVENNSIDPEFTVDKIANTSCDEENHPNGKITITAETDGNPVSAGSTFKWWFVENGIETEITTAVAINDFTSELENAKSGTYKVSIIDNATGCSFEDTFTLEDKSVFPEITDATIVHQDICDPSGSITITDADVAPGDIGDYKFIWYRDNTSSDPLKDKDGNVIETSYLNVSNYPSIGADTFYVKLYNETLYCPSEFAFEAVIQDLSEDPEIVFAQTANTACDTTNHANGILTATATTKGANVTSATFTWYVVEGTTKRVITAADATVVTPSVNAHTSSLVNAKPGKYLVEVIENGCTTEADWTIEHKPVIPEIKLHTVVDQNTCEPSGSITITGMSPADMSNYYFTWYRESTSSAPLKAPNGIDEITDEFLNLTNYPAIGAGIYYVRATIIDGDGMGCYSTPPYEVEIKDVSTPVTLSTYSYSPVTSCINSSNGEIAIIIDEDTDFANYDKYEINWYKGNVGDTVQALGAEISTTYFISNQPAGEYTVQINRDGCKIHWLFRIEEEKVLPVIEISKRDITKCYDDANAIKDGEAAARVINSAGTLTGPLDFFWYKGEFTAQPTGTPFATGANINNLSEGHYTVFVISQATGCVGFDVVEIEDISITPEITIVETPLTNCDVEDPSKSNGQLSASVNGNITDYTFEWYLGSTASGPVIYTGSTLQRATSTTYTVKVTDKVSTCYNTATYTVTENQAVVETPEIAVTNRTNCNFANGAIYATVAGDINNYRFNWYAGSDTNASPLAVTTSFIENVDAGVYTLTITDLTTGCTSAPVSATVSEDFIYPEYEINIQNASCEQPNGLAQIEVTNGVIARVIWETHVGIVEGNAVFELPVGDYRVTVFFANGCSATQDFSVGTDINVYNGVSPNGDNKNDVFKIDCIQLFPTNNVKIFNRSGTLVYEMNGYDNETIYFDGIGNRGLYVLGNELPDGTYFYVVEKNDGSKPKTGYLELLR